MNSVPVTTAVSLGRSDGSFTRSKMAERDTFSSYHPLVNFLYFALVLVFGMCFMHPVCLVISLSSATATVLFLWFAAEPMLEKLDRIKVKYALMD